MKRKIKSYLVFTPLLYRLFVLLLLPLALVALLAWLGTFEGVPPLLSCVLALSLWMASEIVLDQWAFGGIASRAVGQPEYLKSSRRGLALTRTALAMNMVRSLAVMALVLAVGMPLGMWIGGRSLSGGAGSILPMVAALLFAAWMLIQVGSTVTRFLEGMLFNMMAAGGVGILFTGTIYLLDSVMVSKAMPNGALAEEGTPLRAWLGLLVCFVVAVAVAMACLCVLIHRVKECYYDK